MKLNFIPKRSSPPTNYCINCQKSDKLKLSVKKNNIKYICDRCNITKDRALIIDPDIEWWLGRDMAYWHSSVGAIIVNDKNEILLFERVKFPLGKSFAAGHIDAGETARDAIIREVEEETGLIINDLVLLVETQIHGDSCRRGSDDHTWKLYGSKVGNQPVNIDASEGVKPSWERFDEINIENMPYAAATLLKKHAKEIRAFIEPS